MLITVQVNLVLQGENEMKMEEVGGLFVLINDCVFSYIERSNPSVADWTRWWVNSSRYSDVIRLERRRQVITIIVDSFSTIHQINELRI